MLEGEREGGREGREGWRDIGRDRGREEERNIGRHITFYGLGWFFLHSSLIFASPSLISYKYYNERLKEICKKYSSPPLRGWQHFCVHF